MSAVGRDCHGSSGVGKSGMLRDVRERHNLARAVYVGDTRGDQDASEEADMEFGFVCYGFGEASLPSLSFGSFGELVEHFLG